MPCCRPKASPSPDHPAVAARRHELLRPVAPAPTPPRAGFAQLQGSVSPVLPLSPSFSDAGAVHRVPTALGPAPRHGPPPPLHTPAAVPRPLRLTGRPRSPRPRIRPTATPAGHRPTALAGAPLRPRLAPLRLWSALCRSGRAPYRAGAQRPSPAPVWPLGPMTDGPHAHNVL